MYPPPFEIGSKITVLFPRDHPEFARFKSFRTLWFIPTFLFVLGCAFAGIGILALFAVRKTYGNTWIAA
jgi:hypothetical protein